VKPIMWLLKQKEVNHLKKVEAANRNTVNAAATVVVNPVQVVDIAVVTEAVIVLPVRQQAVQPAKKNPGANVNQVIVEAVLTRVVANEKVQAGQATKVADRRTRKDNFLRNILKTGHSAMNDPFFYGFQSE